MMDMIPWRVRQAFVGAVRARKLRSGVGSARASVRRGESIRDESLADIAYGWGNESWAADTAVLVALTREADGEGVCVLECGTGVSTLVLGLLAETGRIDAWSLEHDEKWHRYACEKLTGLGIRTDRILLTPLSTYDSFEWYDVSGRDLPDRLDLVLCDGPPGYIPGGRIGVVPVLKEKLRPGTRIIMDDSHRPEETQTIDAWSRDFGIRLSRQYDGGTFAILKVEQ